MSDLSHSVVFFDIGDTLASVRVSGGSITLNVFPYVQPVLTKLKENGAQLGLLSNRGQIPEKTVNDALQEVGLLPYFQPELILYGPKDSALIFEQAATRVRQLIQLSNPAELTLLFVGEDANERAHAQTAGFLVAPHPKLAISSLSRKSPVRFLRIRVPLDSVTTDWRQTLRALPLVPLHLTASDRGVEVYAFADAPTGSRLDDLGFWVDRLGEEDEPLTSDFYILRDDRQTESGFLQDAGNSFDFFSGPSSARRVLTSTSEGIFISVPAGRSVESYHFRDARHGHNLKLVPSPTLLDPEEEENNERLAATLAAAGEFLTTLDTNIASVALLSDAQKKVLQREITEQALQQDIERYTGLKPISESLLVRSRHIHHPSNAEAVRGLVQDLTRLGAGRLLVRTHQFTHEGRHYENVEGVLPGSGLPGIVLVSAHLDSTGSRQIGYRASTDPVPGADDDASGVAATLGAVRALLAMDATTPRRELRFVFFNAEEHGLIGSRAYAREQALAGARIVAVFQMDMIGFDANTERTFELHVGFTRSPSVEKRSAKLAQLIAKVVPEVSPSLPLPQIYLTDSNQRDPAESRSDHYSFQLEGYAACLVSEDFFVGPQSTSPSPDPNLNYHLPADTSVNTRYAADIARAVAAAAWLTSTR